MESRAHIQSAVTSCARCGSYKREAPKSPFVFVSERSGPFTTDSFNWLVKRAGKKADFPFQVHAHMLRHAAGYQAGRRWSRYAINPRLSWAQKHPAHRALHRAIANEVQGFLARLNSQNDAFFQGRKLVQISRRHPVKTTAFHIPSAPSYPPVRRGTNSVA